MKIFLDDNLLRELQDKTFSLGIVEAGETKRYTYYVKNDTNAWIKELSFSIEHDEVEVIDYPNEIAPQAVGELIIEWSPSVTLKEGLKAQLHILGKELYG